MSGYFSNQYSKDFSDRQDLTMFSDDELEQFYIDEREIHDEEELFLGE